MIVFTRDDFLCKGIEKNGSYDALSVKKKMNSMVRTKFMICSLSVAQQASS